MAPKTKIVWMGSATEASVGSNRLVKMMKNPKIPARKKCAAYHVVKRNLLSTTATLSMQDRADVVQELLARKQYTRIYYGGKFDWGHKRRMEVLRGALSTFDKVNMSLDTLYSVH